MNYEIGPYDSCPCGSGKKYKFCCAAANGDKRHGKYPMGTVAYYGPDDRTPTKIAAGVILSEGAEPIMQRWVSTNILNDEKIGREVQCFFAKHGVKNVVVAEGVLGCPHEEAEDYPAGTTCPFCPFWANRNRWTGQAAPEEEDAGTVNSEEDDSMDKAGAIAAGIDRMDSILGDSEMDHDSAIERLCQHLKSALQLPCIVTGAEDFNWEEPYVFGGWSEREYKKLKKTQPSYTDQFELLDVVAGIVSPWVLCSGDIAARVRRIGDGKLFVLGLSELEVVDGSSPNAQLLRDYSCWFANS